MFWKVFLKGVDTNSIGSVIRQTLSANHQFPENARAVLKNVYGTTRAIRDSNVHLSVVYPEDSLNKPSGYVKRLFCRNLRDSCCIKAARSSITLTSIPDPARFKTIRSQPAATIAATLHCQYDN